MKELRKEDILNYFEEINQRLCKEGKHGDILIAGGAAMTLVYNARASTQDIDAIFKPSEDMRRIIKDIAEEKNINEDWLNDGVKGFFNDKMNGKIIRSYSNLTVSCLETECLLAMKLTSARALSKDMDDSVFLMKVLDIKSQSELFSIIERYTHEKQQTPKSKYFTIEAYERYLSSNRENKVAPKKMSDWKREIDNMRTNNVKYTNVFDKNNSDKNKDDR